MATTTLSAKDKAVLQDLQASIRAASAELADACAYVGTAMRGRFLQLQTAVNDGDLPRIATLVDDIRDSEVVTGLAGKLHHLRERASAAWEALKPWAKTILGLVLGLFGYFMAAELGLILAAILMIGGLLYAITNGYEAATRRADKLLD